MYRNKKLAVIMPAYNEEMLVRKALSSVPPFVDKIFVINDASTDKTLTRIRQEQKQNKKIVLINNETNGGIGYGIKAGLRMAAEQEAQYMAIMAGDAQMDPKYLREMLDELQSRGLDFIKANRFMHYEELKSMPRYRRWGNIIVTILTKFATGYYSIFDTQNGYVIYTKKAVDQMPWHLIGDRYEYENTVLIGLSIIGAKVGDISIPALYGDEKSTIKLFSTTMRVLIVLFKGFWIRIYYKYVLYNFHPVALFLFSGLLMLLLGLIFGVYTVYEKLVSHIIPTSGTVVLVGISLMIGFQLLLTSFILDVMEEKKS